MAVESFDRIQRECRRLGDEDLFRPAKARRLEHSLLRGYIYGADNKAVTARFFTRTGVSELEQKHLSTFMFRLETGIETPSTVLVSLYAVMCVAENVTAATKAALRGMYGTEGEAIQSWLRAAAPRLHRALCPLGCTSSVTPGGTCLITCVMRGQAYNLLKTEVYPLIVPKEVFLDLDEDSTDETKYVYFVITYDYNSDSGGRPSLFLVATRLAHRGTFLNVLRCRFRLSRLLFLNRAVTGGASAECVGYVQRLGSFAAGDAKIGSVPVRTVQLPVVRLEKFSVDPREPFPFV